VKPRTFLVAAIAEYGHARTKEPAMHTLALSTLLFHALATVTMVLSMGVNACLTVRRT
jgi:hypothetical protein